MRRGGERGAGRNRRGPISQRSHSEATGHRAQTGMKKRRMACNRKPDSGFACKLCNALQPRASAGTRNATREPCLLLQAADKLEADGFELHGSGREAQADLPARHPPATDATVPRARSTSPAPLPCGPTPRYAECSEWPRSPLQAPPWRRRLRQTRWSRQPHRQIPWTRQALRAWPTT